MKKKRRPSLEEANELDRIERYLDDLYALEGADPRMNNNNDDDGTMLSTAEVARRLGVSDDTIRKLIGDGRLAAFQIGHHFRVEAKTVEQYLLARATPTSNRVERPLSVR